MPLILIAGRTSDRLVEITLTMLIAYGSFLLAEHFHASGVLATLTAGLIVGNYGFLGSISRRRAGRRCCIIWEFVAFLVNSLIFILIGGREAAMPILRGDRGGGGRDGAVAARARRRGLSGDGVIRAHAAARCRGNTSMCCSGADCAARSRWRWRWRCRRRCPSAARSSSSPFAVVAFSIFVQGLTMPWLIRRLGLGAASKSRTLAAPATIH